MGPRGMSLGMRVFGLLLAVSLGASVAPTANAIGSAEYGPFREGFRTAAAYEDLGSPFSSRWKPDIPHPQNLQAETAASDIFFEDLGGRSSTIVLSKYNFSGIPAVARVVGYRFRLAAYSVTNDLPDSIRIEGLQVRCEVAGPESDVIQNISITPTRYEFSFDELNSPSCTLGQVRGEKGDFGFSFRAANQNPFNGPDTVRAYFSEAAVDWNVTISAESVSPPVVDSQVPAVVRVSGTNFINLPAPARVTCRFDGRTEGVTDGTVMSPTQISCAVPTLPHLSTKNVSVEVSLDGATWSFPPLQLLYAVSSPQSTSGGAVFSSSTGGTTRSQNAEAPEDEAAPASGDDYTGLYIGLAAALCFLCCTIVGSVAFFVHVRNDAEAANLATSVQKEERGDKEEEEIAVKIYEEIDAMVATPPVEEDSDDIVYADLDQFASDAGSAPEAEVEEERGSASGFDYPGLELLSERMQVDSVTPD